MRLALCLVALVTAIPAANAEDFYRKVGGWEVGETDGDCSIYQEFEGPGETTLILSRKLDGRIYVGIANRNWTAEAGKSYDISYAVNGYVFSGGGAIGYNREYSGRGFIAQFGEDFLKEFAKGAGLRMYLDKTLVDNLSLDGSAAALATLDRCMAKIRADKAAVEREEKRWEHIPADPFATAAPRPPVNRPATPRGNPGAWLTLSDYPASALRLEQQGTTRFTVTVTPEGRVSDCTVTTSSGSSVLDAATCAIMTRRGRFEPATDAQGRPVTGSWSSTTAWSIPSG